MDFSLVLPMPVLACKTFYDNFSNRANLGDKQLDKYNEAKATLWNTALAVGGYFLAMKYAKKLDLEFYEVAAIATLINPEIARIAVGGHFIWHGVFGAISSNGAARVTAASLAAIGYFANSEGGRQFKEYVYSFI